MIKKIEVPIIGTVIGTMSEHQDETEARLRLVLGVEMLVNTRSMATRLHLNIAAPDGTEPEKPRRFYLLMIRGGVEPDLRGSYETGERRDYAARTLRQHPADSAFALDVDAQGVPTITEYSAEFFEGPKS
jgi:hypothetical protein